MKMNNHPAVRLVQYPGEQHGNARQTGRRDLSPPDAGLVRLVCAGCEAAGWRDAAAGHLRQVWTGRIASGRNRPDIRSQDQHAGTSWPSHQAPEHVSEKRHGIPDADHLACFARTDDRIHGQPIEMIEA